VFGNVSKVLVDSRQGNNLLYLPLDKIIAQTAEAAKPAAAPVVVAPPIEASAPTRADQLRNRDR
jgi:modulator of FtsH protease HflK